MTVTRADVDESAETTAWVSNTAQTLSTSFIRIGDKDKRHSQGFTTGAESGGYSLGSVGVYVDDEDLESGETLTVHIYTANATGAIDTLMHTLISPGSYADGAVNLFTAPADATLDPNTDYLVVFEATGNVATDFALGLTSSPSEDSGSATGWSIEDNRRFDNSITNGIFVISVNAGTAVTSNDATLSELSLSGVTLSPVFAADTMTYTASVGNDVTSTTVTAKANHDGATVAIFPADADDTADGHQVALDVGETAVSVTVTAEDGTTTQTYAVTVTRAEAEELAETTVPSNWSLVPHGLGAGDRFRLLFLTSGTSTSNFNHITTYNTFVQNAAAAGHPGIRQYSAGFRVVGSTADVDARDNTRTTYTADDKGVPIYWLNSVNKVADDYEDFYDGSWATESVISNEAGLRLGLIDLLWNVLTGSNHDGTEAFDGTTSRAFGSAGLHTRLGKLNSTASGEGPLSSAQNTGNATLRPLYALSQVFLVGEARATAAPAFSADSATRDVAENSPAGTDVGDRVIATDTDTGDALTYTLEGTDAASFIIDASTGQIQTKADVTYDHEANSSYSVTVKADDNYGGADTITVTINITDVDEPPAAPAVPTVVAVAGTSDSLSVRWLAPDNAGKPDIDSYDLQYRKGTTGDFTDGPQDQTGKMATITGLDANSAYEVHVRATNDEGDGAWSSPGTGATHADVLVANLTEAFNLLTTKTIELDWAQAFDTGSNTEGYSLESIALRNTGADTRGGRLDGHGASGQRRLARRHGALHADQPGRVRRRHDAGVPTLENGLLAFTAPAGATLDPNTTYWVVFVWDADRTDGLNKGGPRFIKTRLRHGIDAGGAPGWTIDAPAQKRKTGNRAPMGRARRSGRDEDPGARRPERRPRQQRPTGIRGGIRDARSAGKQRHRHERRRPGRGDRHRSRRHADLHPGGIRRRVVRDRRRERPDPDEVGGRLRLRGAGVLSGDGQGR